MMRITLAVISPLIALGGLVFFSIVETPIALVSAQQQLGSPADNLGGDNMPSISQGSTASITNVADTGRDNTTTTSEHTLSVTGSANIKVKPDTIFITIGVRTNGTTAQKALQDNANLMNKVMDALASAGLGKNESRTSLFAINPIYNSTRFGAYDKLQGYTVSNSIQIESTNIGNASQWIDVAVAAGANRVDSIYFGLSDERTAQLKMDLIEKATDNARGQAERLATALSVDIIGVQKAEMQRMDFLPYYPDAPHDTSTAATGQFNDSTTPITAGNVTISLDVMVTYLIH